MKKTLKMAALACLIGSAGIQTSNAQDGAAEHFKDLRIFGGINIGSVTTEGTRFTLINSVAHKKSIEGQIGVQAGLSMTFGNHFYISPGIWYGTHTSNTFLIEEDKDNNDVDFEKETTLSTIAIPVRLGFRFINPNAENIFNIRLYGGVTGAHVIGVSHKGDSEIKLDEKDFEKLMVAATGGVGVDVLFFFLDVGYDLGLTGYEKNVDKSRHNSMFANLGVKFKI